MPKVYPIARRKISVAPAIYLGVGVGSLAFTVYLACVLKFILKVVVCRRCLTLGQGQGLQLLAVPR